MRNFMNAEFWHEVNRKKRLNWFYDFYSNFIDKKTHKYIYINKNHRTKLNFIHPLKYYLNTIHRTTLYETPSKTFSSLYISFRVHKTRRMILESDRLYYMYVYIVGLHKTVWWYNLCWNIVKKNDVYSYIMNTDT